MRLVIVLLLALVDTAAARCTDYRGRPCRFRVTTLAAEYLRAPDLAELHATLMRFDLRDDADHSTGWGLECIRLDLVDTTPGGDLPSFEVSGSGLAVRYTFARDNWRVTAGIYLVTVWNETGRFMTPTAELHVGNTSLTWRTRGLYAFTEHDADVPARSFTRDFELEARTHARALAVRARYRDLDTGGRHVRDFVLAIGLQPFARRGYIQTTPSFVGVGIRRELARDLEITDALARRVTPPASPWQLLAWLELDLGFEQRGR